MNLFQKWIRFLTLSKATALIILTIFPMNKQAKVGAALVPIAVPMIWMNNLMSNSKMFHIRTSPMRVIRKLVGIDRTPLLSSLNLFDGVVKYKLNLIRINIQTTFVKSVLSFLFKFTMNFQLFLATLHLKIPSLLAKPTVVQNTHEADQHSSLCVLEQTKCLAVEV